jgi:type II secretory pathway pseudopilin PulG
MPSQEGFTYVGILLAVALVGTQLAVAGLVWSFAQDRQKERELLFVGDQFRTAIGRYYLNPQGPQKEFPRRLEDLVQDPRYPGVVRHLRKIYADPITGKVRWGLIKTPDGSIIGVYSPSEKAPVKIGNFSPAYNSFEKKRRYADWKFVYTVGLPFGLTPGPAGSPGSPSASQKASSATSDIQIYSLEEEDKGKSSSFSGTDLFSGMKFGEPPKKTGGQ